MIRINYEQKMIITNDIKFGDIDDYWRKHCLSLFECPIIIKKVKGEAISAKAKKGWNWIYNRYPIGPART